MMIFDHTTDPHYIQKRKELSSSFFKSKLLGICEIIKEMTLKEIKKLQESPNLDNFDVTDFTMSLQSRIIINILVGKGYSQRTVRWENDDGSFSEQGIVFCISKIMAIAMTRTQLPINVLFPELTGYFIHASDRRYKRNVDSLRGVMQSIIDDRRKGSAKSFTGEDNDTLSVLLSSSSYEGRDELIKDELFGFFLAGMKTVQITTTNLIYYLTKHDDIRAKLMKEILPVVDAAKNDI